MKKRGVTWALLGSLKTNRAAAHEYVEFSRWLQRHCYSVYKMFTVVARILICGC